MKIITEFPVPEPTYDQLNCITELRLRLRRNGSLEELTAEETEAIRTIEQYERWAYNNGLVRVFAHSSDDALRDEEDRRWARDAYLLAPTLHHSLKKYNTDGLRSYEMESMMYLQASASMVLCNQEWGIHTDVYFYNTAHFQGKEVSLIHPDWRFYIRFHAEGKSDEEIENYLSDFKPYLKSTQP